MKKINFLFLFFLIIPFSVAELLTIDLGQPTSDCYFNKSGDWTLEYGPYTNVSAVYTDFYDISNQCFSDKTYDVLFGINSASGNVNLTWNANTEIYMKSFSALQYFDYRIDFPTTYNTSITSNVSIYVCVNDTDQDSVYSDVYFFFDGKQQTGLALGALGLNRCGLEGLSEKIINTSQSIRFDSIVWSRRLGYDATDQITDAIIYIENLNNLNWSVGDNSLPDCNITVDSYQKCTGENGLATFDLDIDCSDDEEDTIYYAVEQRSYDPRYIYIEEDFDYDVFSSEYFYTNETVLSTIAGTNAWKLGLFDTPIITIGQSLGTNMLIVNKGADDFSFNMPNAVSNSTTSTYNIHFKNDTLIDVDYRSESEIISTLTINYTDGNLELEIDNIKVFDNDINPFREPDSDYLTVSTSVTSDTQYLSFGFLTDDYTYTDVISNKSSYNLKSIVFKDQDTYTDDQLFWGLSGVNIRGYWYSMEPTTWSTSYSDLTLSTGNHRYQIYTSDDIHYENTYNSENIFLSVDEYEGCTEQNDTNNVIGVTKTVIGNPMINFFKVNNAYEQGKTGMWFLYLVMLVLGCIANFKMFQKFMVIEVNLGLSLVFAILSVLLAYTINAISFFVLGAISIAVILTREQT